MGIGTKYGITASTGNNIQTIGLIAYWDAAYKKSYTTGSLDTYNLASGSLTPTGSLKNDTGFVGLPTASWDFDGVDDYIDCGDINELDDVTVFTISSWFKLDGTGNNETIFAKTTDANNRVDIIKAAGALYFQLHSGGNGYLGLNFSSTDWTHVAMVFDGSQGGTIPGAPYYQAGLQCYLNGSKITTFNAGSGTIPSTTPTLSNNFLIGEYDVASGYELEGKISNLQIYNRALTSGDILQNYNAQKDRFGY